MDVTEENPSLIPIDNYFDRFYEIKGTDLSDKAAYLILEEEYLKKYSMNRYSSYPSFKSNKWKYLNKLIQRKTKKVTKGYQIV